MLKIIWLTIITIVFTVNMFFAIEAANNIGSVLESTGVRDKGQVTILLVSLLAMVVCTLLAYLTEDKIHWDDFDVENNEEG